MRPKSTPEKWLAADDGKKLQWTWNYLQRRGAPLQGEFPGEGVRDFLLQQLERWLNTDVRRFYTLRSNWNVWHHKDRKGRKGRSFTLSTEAVRKLKHLAKLADDAPLNRTVEYLIERGFNFEEEARKEAKEELEIAKQRLASNYAAGQGRALGKFLKRKYSAEITARDRVIDVLIFETCRHKVLLAAHGLQVTPQALTHEQIAQANQAYQDGIEHYQKQIAATGTVMALGMEKLLTEVREGQSEDPPPHDSKS